MIDALAALLLAPTDIRPGKIHADAYLGLSYQYVYRGIAERDDGPVTRAGLALQEQNGWFIDIWGARTEQRKTSGYYNVSFERQWEWDINAGISHALNNDWAVTLSHAWVERRHADGFLAGDYREWRTNLFYRDAMAWMVAYSDDYRSSGWPSSAIEGELQQPWGEYIDWQAGAGRVDGVGGRKTHYEYGWIGCSGDIRPLQWRLRLYHSGNQANRVLGEDRAGRQWEFVLLLPWELLR